MTEWQDISTAPKDGTYIIGIFLRDNLSHPIVNDMCWYEKDEDGPAGWYDDYGEMGEPSYWIPMPEIPKKKHECRRGTFKCISHRCLDDHFELYHSSTYTICQFCPFCGEKA